MKFGVAGYVIVRENQEEVQSELKRITNVQEHADGHVNYQQWLANTQLEQQVSLEDYSVSNCGLRSGLAGTPVRSPTCDLPSQKTRKPILNRGHSTRT
jgi:dimethylsulfone monooxygenase